MGGSHLNLPTTFHLSKSEAQLEILIQTNGGCCMRTCNRAVGGRCWVPKCPFLTWVYCIRQKSDVFDTFKKWKYLAENETRKRLKCLRYDNGGEYCSKEFNSYYSHNGIHREKTVPGTPQENGVSEMMNRTIMEHARCMRLHAGLPLQFWDDVINIVV